MIRVLQIVTQMNLGGLENRLMDIYRSVDRETIQFDFYTNRLEEGKFDSEIKDLGGRVFYSEPIRPGKERNKAQEFSSFLTKHLEYRIVHSHVNEWSTLFCQAAMKANVPVRIAHSRGANKSISLATLYKDVVRLSIKKYATHYFAVSKEAGEHLFGKRAVEDGKVEIWPNAINAEKFRFDTEVRRIVRSEFNVGDALTIIHVGNLLSVKNHMFLLEVFSEIKKVIGSAQLFLIGEGEQRKAIEEWISKHQLQNEVHVLGIRKDVPSLLQAGDVFVFPSFHEGFPGAVLEAEAAGLPCLISDTITPEVCLTDDCRQMSLKASPAEWAKVAIELSTHGRKDTYTELCEKGYDIKGVAKQYEAFYISAIGGTKT